MKEHDGVRPSPETDCGLARNALQDLWVDGSLSEVRAEGTEVDAKRIVFAAASRGRRGLVDSAIIRHISSCPSCRQEVDELHHLGRSLQAGLESLCGAIAERMDEDIEGTLRKLRQESENARFLRRIRRSLRLVLWISFLAFTLLAGVALAVAVYEALKGL